MDESVFTIDDYLDECNRRPCSANYFGTDGIRGRVGEPPITPDLVLKLGWAAGRTLVAADGTRAATGPAC